MKNFWLDRFPDFNELVQKKDKSKLEKLLLLCIVSLSSHPAYANKTFEEIYNAQIDALQNTNLFSYLRLR